MSTQTTTTASSAEADTEAPLLLPRQEPPTSPSVRSPTSLGVLLGRATGHRGPSMLVRESAARELDQRRADWGYSKPVVALDILWNIAFVFVSITMLILTADERPNTPIRLWIFGYAAQCLVHVVLVWLEYRSRNNRRVRDEERQQQQQQDSDGGNIDSEDDNGLARGSLSSGRLSITKRCESVNTMASFLWWIVGFYWVVSGGDILLQNASHLYWLAVVFLAFDVFFAIFCVVLACLIGIALCCCLPCIIAILYAVAGQEGASEADLSTLRKYRFQVISDEEKPGVGAGKMVPIETSSGYLASEQVLLPEDAECCICLCQYDDGAELSTLPCNHHFHSTCIIKWLKMNATCPLCKYNILKGNEQV